MSNILVNQIINPQSGRTMLSDEQSRAKCLEYRNGKRCGRLATRIVGHQARCAECAGQTDARYISAKGFSVKEIEMCGMRQRVYVSIETGERCY